MDITCIVCEAVVERHLESDPIMAPVLEWLTGVQRLLFVELQPINLSGDALTGMAKQTATGTKLGEGKDGSKHEERWAWTKPGTEGQGVWNGGCLAFRHLKILEFTLRVVGSFMNWELSLAMHMPLEHLGEARFRVAMENLGSEICVPLHRDGRVCGYVALIVQMDLHSRGTVDGKLEAQTAGFHLDVDSRPFLPT